MRARRKPKDAVRKYGILVGKVKDGILNPDGTSPHYEIWVKADSDYRVAVNVQSVDGSDVYALFDPDFRKPTKLNLPTRATGGFGFTELKTGPDGEGLDYLRDNLFSVKEDMTQIPDDGPGVTLSKLMDAQIERAKADVNAVIMVCGEFFQDGGKDKTFHFSPEKGVHDIHMMQGNSGSFADDNRVNGDGALFIRFTDGETIAFFSRFSVQTFPTDDQTGGPKNI